LISLRRLCFGGDAALTSFTDEVSQAIAVNSLAACCGKFHQLRAVEPKSRLMVSGGVTYAAE
jgi:hypothetical protein